MKDNTKKAPKMSEEMRRHIKSLRSGSGMTVNAGTLTPPEMIELGKAAKAGGVQILFRGLLSHPDREEIMAGIKEADAMSHIAF